MTDIAEKIRNYPDNARVIVTWHHNGRWSEDAFPIGELKRLVEEEEPIVTAEPIKFYGNMYCSTCNDPPCVCGLEIPSIHAPNKFESVEEIIDQYAGHSDKSRAKLPTETAV